jgi:8-oxo-dGTP pyrophosphatase MutT (NUDIX family)
MLGAAPGRLPAPRRLLRAAAAAQLRCVAVGGGGGAARRRGGAPSRSSVAAPRAAPPGGGGGTLLTGGVATHGAWARGMAASPPPPRRPVTTAFVLDPATGRYLLVRRSERVSTYPLLWGGVSGGVEPGDASLTERARTEVEEETALTSLTLLRVGRPLPVDDGDRRFLVFPFLFALRDAASPGAAQQKVHLNWENTEHRWVTAEELVRLPAVPSLARTLARLVLPPGLQAHVDRLAADRSHGAAELAGSVLAAFSAAAADLPFGDGAAEKPKCKTVSEAAAPAAAVPDEAPAPAPAAAPAEAPALVDSEVDERLEALRDFGFLLAAARPSMAPLAAVAALVLLQTEEALLARADPFGPDATLLRRSLESAVERVAALLAATGAQQEARTAALLRPGMRLLTLSYSSSVARGVEKFLRSRSGENPPCRVRCVAPAASGPPAAILAQPPS